MYLNCITNHDGQLQSPSLKNASSISQKHCNPVTTSLPKEPRFLPFPTNCVADLKRVSLIALKVGHFLMHFPSRFFSRETREKDWRTDAELAGGPGCVTAWCPNFLEQSPAAPALQRNKARSNPINCNEVADLGRETS